MYHFLEKVSSEKCTFFRKDTQSLRKKVRDCVRFCTFLQKKTRFFQKFLKNWRLGSSFENFNFFENFFEKNFNTQSLTFLKFFAKNLHFLQFIFAKISRSFGLKCLET